MNVSITFSFETGTINYYQSFIPLSYFQLVHPLGENHPSYILPSLLSFMNIISWNVRGANSTKFRKAFCDLINAHSPYAMIITETHLSGESNNPIIALGSERYIKLDTMGFSGGIWVL